MRFFMTEEARTGMIVFGLCAVLVAPCLVQAAATCRAAPDASAQASYPDGLLAEEVDYLRLHQEVMAPLLFLDLESRMDGVERGIDQPHRSYRGDAGPVGPAGG